DRVGAGERLPPRHPGRPVGSAGRGDGARGEAGGRAGAAVRRRTGLDRRHHPPHAARDPHRDLRARGPADPAPGGRVRGHGADRRGREDLRRLGSQLPRSRVTSANPRLRAVEAFPVEHEGQRCIALRDPAGFTDQIAVLPGPLLDLVSLFDGEHPLEAIREIVRRRHGEAPTLEQIEILVERLDEAGFLESERFEVRRRAAEDAFRQSPTRPAAHAGGAYAGQPDALRAQIAGFFAHPDGPGAAETRPAAAGGRLAGLIAPHIDFHRGGPTYAWAYQDLLDRSDADLFVILGTCHAGMPDPFAVTLKPYDTPLGPVPVDRDLYEALRARAGQDLLASEPAHRVEHSIEFQAVMLQTLLGPRRPFTILPVLASYLHEAVWLGTEPEADPRVPRFLDGLRETIAA